MAEKAAVVRLRPHLTEKKVKNPKKIKGENIFLEHIKYCCSTSSMHGLNQIVRSNRSPLERLFWICAVVGFTYFGISKGYEVVQHYFKRPSMISVEFDFKNWKTEFPSSLLCQQSLNDTFLRSRNITENSEIYQYLIDLAFTNFTSYHLYEKYANGSRKEYLKPEEYLQVLLEAVPTLTPERAVKSSLPLNLTRPIRTIITEIGICSIVNPSNGVYYSPEYFNSSEPVNFEPILYGYGFGSMLKCELRDFYGNFKAAILPPNELPDIATKVHYFRDASISVFTISVLSLYTPEGIEKLDIHQRNCRLSDEAGDLDHSPKYTPKLCQIECKIKLCLKYCNCTPYYYRRNPGENICNMTGMYCLSQYIDELMHVADYKANGSDCNCLQGCYGVMVVTEDISTTAFLADGRLTVQILIASDKRYVRKLIFTKLDLFVQIGGILGLCLGCTISGIIEVIYFMTLRFYWSVFRGRSIKSSL